jgi:hypothetical protein
VSFAARGEDVVLHRALGSTLPVPRYAVLRGAPLRGLDQHGWTRSEVAPPTDQQVHAVVVRIEPDDPGEVLAARPWVCLVSGRADGPLAAALREGGYAPAFFDGASTFLVHPGHIDSLVPLLDHPAQPDEFVPARVVELGHEVEAWQARALEPWSVAAATEITAGRVGGAEALARELDAIRSTVSWRVTAPLRVLRRRQTGL